MYLFLYGTIYFPDFKFQARRDFSLCFLTFAFPASNNGLSTEEVLN